jgi:hypothetical protein
VDRSETSVPAPMKPMPPVWKEGMVSLFEEFEDGDVRICQGYGRCMSLPAFDISTAISANAIRRIGAPTTRGVWIHG